MKVFTIGRDINGREVVVEHNALRLKGIPGERWAECTGKTDKKLYCLSDKKQTIFLSENEAIAAMEPCIQVG